MQSNHIAERLGVSATYVTKVFQPLCNRGWLHSVKGRAGGWVMVMDPAKITLAEVVEILEPGQQWKRCIIGHEICSDGTGCPFHEAWSQAIAQFAETMRGITLDRLPEALPPCFENALEQRILAERVFGARERT